MWVPSREIRLPPLWDKKSVCNYYSANVTLSITDLSMQNNGVSCELMTQICVTFHCLPHLILRFPKKKTWIFLSPKYTFTRLFSNHRKKPYCTNLTLSKTFCIIPIDVLLNVFIINHNICKVYFFLAYESIWFMPTENMFNNSSNGYCANFVELI